LKILILYYSGTGNTRFACDIARLVMEKAGHEITMKAYAKAGKEDIGDFDLYCFAAPVYEWAPARNVERFVTSMTRLPGKRAFIITSSAGATGQAIPLFARMLESKGLTLLGNYNLICPDSWGGTRRWSYSQDAETPTVESVRELAAFTGKMLEAAEGLEQGRAVDLPEYRVRPTGLFFASRASRLAPSSRVKMGKKKVDTKECTECGVCAKNCPSGAITLDPYPRFGSQCIACWRCINTCPADCITTLVDSSHHYKGIVDKDALLKQAGLK
jgi:ferredoxin/flavodoxin